MGRLFIFYTIIDYSVFFYYHIVGDNMNNDNLDNELKNQIRQEIIEENKYVPTEAEVELYANFAKVQQEEEENKNNKPITPMQNTILWFIILWFIISIVLTIFFLVNEQISSFCISLIQLVIGAILFFFNTRK